MTKRNLILLLALVGLSFTAFSQQQRWQQKVSYKMDIEMDVEKHQYHGEQLLEYTNNSPE
ncbi:MAG: hypothetical protein HRT74_01125, partial [Flavobacteriales bacterium]|nr:hypothetical protein [Flavobacteriales bacterium]